MINDRSVKQSGTDCWDDQGQIDEINQELVLTIFFGVDSCYHSAGTVMNVPQGNALRFFGFRVDGYRGRKQNFYHSSVSISNAIASINRNKNQQNCEEALL